jgi:hypothetical protein
MKKLLICLIFLQGCTSSFELSEFSKKDENKLCIFYMSRPGGYKKYVEIEIDEICTYKVKYRKRRYHGKRTGSFKISKDQSDKIFSKTNLLANQSPCNCINKYAMDGQFYYMVYYQANNFPIAFVNSNCKNEDLDSLIKLINTITGKPILTEQWN